MIRYDDSKLNNDELTTAHQNVPKQLIIDNFDSTEEGPTIKGNANCQGIEDCVSVKRLITLLMYYKNDNSNDEIDEYFNQNKHFSPVCWVRWVRW